MTENIHIFSDGKYLGTNLNTSDILPYPLEKDKDTDWYINNVNWLLGLANNPNPSIPFPFDINDNGVSENSIKGWQQPWYQMFLNYSYCLGKQPNLNSAWMTLNVDNTVNAHAVWAKGARVASIVDKLIGYWKDNYLDDIRFAADPLSPECKAVRDKIIEREEALFELKPYWDKWIKEFLSMPQQAKPFESPEELKQWQEDGIKDYMSDVYLKIVIDNYERQCWTRWLDRYALDTFACDCASIYHYVEQGYYKTMLVPPYSLVFDTSIDNDPYGERRGSRGFFEMLDLNEAYYRYPQLKEKDKHGKEYFKYLYEIAISETGMNQFNALSPNYMWWQIPGSFNGNWYNVKVAVFHAFILGSEMIQGKPFETWYQADIVGGKFMLNYGKCNNIVEDPYMPQNVMCPLQIFTPRMMLGCFNSFVSRVRTLQDDYDKLRYKKQEMIGKQTGMNTVFRGEALGDEMDEVKIQKDFRKLGLTISKPSAMANNPSDNRPLAYQLNNQLDPSYDKLTGEQQLIYAEIEMYFGGQTPITLGEQNKYIGKDAYADGKNTGALGTYNIFEQMLYFLQRNLDMGVHIKKNLIEAGVVSKSEAENIIGEKGMRILKKVKNKYVRQMMILLKLDDKPSEKLKEQIFEIARAYAGNPQDPNTRLDLIKMLDAKTKTKLMDEIKAADRRQKKEMDERMKAEMQYKQDKDAKDRQLELQLAVLPQTVKDKAIQLNKESKDKADKTKREIAGLPTEQHNIPLPMAKELAQQPNAPETGQAPTPDNAPSIPNAPQP